MVYRSQRSFVGVVIKGDKDIALEHHLCFLETSQKEKAYYYCGALNYLVSKVKKGFIRDQFARPLVAIIKAGLEWKGEDWQKRVSELSEELHKKAPEVYKGINSNLVKKIHSST